jgi:hypothetical protein
MKSTAYIDRESAVQGRHSAEQFPGLLPTLRTTATASHSPRELLAY